MISNGRGALNLIPKLQEFAGSVVAIMENLAASETTYSGWNTANVKPKIVRLCDEPGDLIQPQSPALVFTLTGRSVVDATILYDYRVTVTYVYASPVERAWGDDALFACGLAAEAIYQATREARPAGINSINYSGYDISPMMTTTSTQPLLSRILTVDLDFQIEEDF